MGIICLFLPAVVYCCVRWKVQKNYRMELSDTAKWAIVNYSVGVMLINLCMYIVVAYLFKNNGNLYANINGYAGFAAKYLAVSIVLAIFFPYAEKYAKILICEKVSFHASFSKLRKFKQWRAVVTAYAIILFLLNFIRIFDNNFWGDECIPRVAAQLGFVDMLHYILVWATVRIFGSYGAVYHMVSLTPYAIGIVLALTVIYKWFGKETSIIYISFSSLLGCAVQYNVEVRMYSWCALFVLLLFLSIYKIYVDEKSGYFILAALFSAGAEYSHNFSLACVAIIYFVMFLYFLSRKKYGAVVKTALSGSAALASYVPWMVFQRNPGRSVMSDYSISANSINECIIFMFKSKWPKLFLVLFAAFLILAIFYGFGILQTGKETETGKWSIQIKLDKISPNPEMIWMLGGLCAAFGTIFAARLISYMIYPILLLRYVYATFVIVWLAFGICVSKCKLKSFYTAGIVVLVLVSCVPSYIATYQSEASSNRVLKKTLATLDTLFDEDDIILTDGTHLAWTIIKSYYPDVRYSKIELPDGISEIPDDGNQYWIMLVEAMPDDALEQMHENGYDAEAVKLQYNSQDGILGCNRIWLYKVVGGYVPTDSEEETARLESVEE